MSAVDRPWGQARRSARGHNRILDAIGEFEKLKIVTGCAACQGEITRQLKLQAQGLAEIKAAWAAEPEFSIATAKPPL
jgi:hypothetical protein